MNEKEKKVLIFLSTFFILGSFLFFLDRKKATFKEEIEESVKLNLVKKININEATKEELISLPGIGEKIAQRIIEYREKKGRFKNKSELLKIKGIGKKRLSKIENLIEIK